MDIDAMDIATQATPDDALKNALREMRCCPECGSAFAPVRKDQKFCKRPCLRAWHSRAADRGSTLYHLAMEWRRSRGKVKMGDVTFLLDQWISVDKDQTDRYKTALEALEKAKKEK